MTDLGNNLLLAQSSPGNGDSILPLIVWGIIGLFWLIAQIAQKKKDFARLKQQGQQQPERQATHQPVQRSRPQSTQQPTPSKTRVDVEDEMRAFIEQLTGNAPQPPKPAAPPPPRPVEAPPPMPVKRAPLIAFDDAAAPPTASSNESQDRIDELQDIDDSIYDLDDTLVYKEAASIIDITELEREIEGEALHAPQALISVRSFIIDFDTLTVPIMRTQIQSMRPVRTKINRPKLANRKALRQAIVSRIIFSPCKALDDDIFRTDQGAM